MRILTLFLALFLTLLPEGGSYVSPSYGQDVGLEEVCDVEEEAIIRTPQRWTEKVQAASDNLTTVPRAVFVPVQSYPPVPICFERRWLFACMLRL